MPGWWSCATARRRRRGGSRASCGMIRPRASCDMPMPAMRRQSRVRAYTASTCRACRRKSLGRGGENGLAANLLRQSCLERGEFTARLDGVMPRMRQLDPHVRLDAPRPRGHDHHARGKEDRFLDVMGNEQHGFALPFPDAKKQLLHQCAGLVVERPERLL